MPSKKSTSSWHECVHESSVKRNALGQLSLTIKGGAEDNSFPCFGEVEQTKVLYERYLLIGFLCFLLVNCL